ncbi:DUF5343 domain-containing protein [Mycobacterium marseillense]|uniref:DUF5343 domain-containing protein n=1 Tax=Mycobacterium marseillense TaxID=701042 RepID=UPI0025953B78|nr:DUF5343 domain-containing protein [Mycobacterium marseillense]MDM3973276.1 DUF5343 domain-containing protein [Mycobacterium marseillense]
MAEPASDSKKPLPPYIAFKTLTDVVERMERDDIPTRVDPSYLDSYAGGYRPTVISNLQTLGLLGKGGEPTERLEALVYANEAERQRLVGELISEFYSDIFALGLNSTQSQFLEAFVAKGVRGDTRRKAISFFLKACAYSGVKVGSLWKTPPAAPTGSSAKRKPQQTVSKNDEAPTSEQATVQHGAGERVVVDLGTAGRVTVHVDVKWLELDDPDVKTLRDAIKSLQQMASPAGVLGAEDDADDDEAEGAEV